ncbi:MAG: hypothetical protein NXY59_01555 [Aigarchaeota archaeon]|nr:hypothetical protein [Candidatus Pelearchaeum maunauluense]
MITSQKTLYQEKLMAARHKDPHYLFLLFLSIPMFIWYDKQALTALQNMAIDKSGNAVFLSENQVIYPFTYAGALLTILGITSLMARRYGFSISNLIVSLLLGRAVAGALIVVYEQIFTLLGSIVWKENVWLLYYGDIETLLWNAAKVGFLITLLPHINPNMKYYTTLILATYFILMISWMALGMRPPHQDALNYALNATTRLLLHAVPLTLLLRGRGFQA